MKPSSLLPIITPRGKVLIEPGRSEIITLDEGTAVTVIGNASASGTSFLVGSDGTAVSGTTAAISAGATKVYGPYSGTNKVSIVATTGSIDAMVGNAVLGAAQVAKNSAGNAFGLTGSGGIMLPGAAYRSNRRHVSIGDSQTAQGTKRATGFYDGTAYYQTTTVTTPANIGGTGWVYEAKAQGTVPAGGGTLETDGAGSVRFTASGDTAGPWVNIAQGGWYLLSSGTLPGKLHIAVRGATTPPASPGSTAITVSGSKNIISYDLFAFSAMRAGMLGAIFTDYQFWGIPGCTSSDALKFTPQALAYGSVDSVTIQIGVNDNADTVVKAQLLVSNIQGIAQLALAAGARDVHINEIFPNTNFTANAQKYTTLAMNLVRAWARNQPNIKFVSAFDNMIDTSAVALTKRTGVFDPDSLHLVPFGGYTAAWADVQEYRRDYVPHKERHNISDAWDTTLQTGAWNANPNLRGTAGTVTGGAGITGTVPDGYSMQRAGGANQLVTTSFKSAKSVDPTDNGIDWFWMAFSVGTAGESHTLTRNIAVPAGVAIGDSVKMVMEFCIGPTTGNGFAASVFQANGSNGTDNFTLFTCSKAVATFTTEYPVYRLESEPMKLSALSAIFCTFQAGLSAGATGECGIRLWKLEKAT